MTIVLFMLEKYSKQQVLFGITCLPCFQIYLEPEHPSNRIFTFIFAQLSAAFIGFGLLCLLGGGYITAIVAMIVSIIVMVFFGRMHPPAVSTALIFAFTNVKSLPLFLIAVGILSIQVSVQKLLALAVQRKSMPGNINNKKE